MNVSRRKFLCGALAGAGAAAVIEPHRAHASAPVEAAPEAFGCLVDIGLCDACRKCEEACNRNNELPKPDRPFDDLRVLDTPRRPHADAFTVINKYALDGRAQPLATKVQCMHCIDPACASACIVGALRKDPRGPVSYDASICIGCRYCMVACPFQIPAYEYHDPLTPRVRKCTFCEEATLTRKEAPACAKACPKEVMVFGPRSQLLEIARERIAAGSDHSRTYGPYVQHIYGEHEVGGTSWLYIAPAPVTQLGLPALPNEAPPRLTESIQHGVFKYFVPPIGLASALGAVMFLFRRRDEHAAEQTDHAAPVAAASPTEEK